MSVRPGETLSVSPRVQAHMQTHVYKMRTIQEKGGCSGICCGARAHLLRGRLPGTPDFESCQLVELF